MGHRELWDTPLALNINERTRYTLSLLLKTVPFSNGPDNGQQWDTIRNTPGQISTSTDT